MTSAKDIAHGFHLLKNGGLWWAVGPEFVDLLQSPAGFGVTKEQAVNELRAALRQAGDQNHRLPRIGDFTVHRK